MTQIGIIADDLTGACDTALQFFNAGLGAVVALSEVGIHFPNADVIAVSTHSRHCAPSEAYRRVTDAVKRMRAAGIGAFYKKIDSALRGNIGSELDAFGDALGAEAVVVASSFPAHGRTIVQGNLFVKGQRLTDTAMAREHAIASCAVVEIISRTTHSAVRSIPLEVIRSGRERLEQELQAVVAAGFKILVCDAVTDEDLSDIACVIDACVVARRSRWLGAGSAGLAAALARLHSPVPSRTRRGITQPRAGGRLAVVGSQHPMARAQLEWLSRGGEVHVLALSPEALRSDYTGEISRIAQEIHQRVAEGNDAALTIKSSSTLPQDARTAQALAQAMGEIVSGSCTVLGGLVIVGGDTAMAILDALESESAEIIAEVEPGMPALALRGGRSPELPLVTKAGSFGNRESLALAWQFLEHHQS